MNFDNILKNIKILQIIPYQILPISNARDTKISQPTYEWCNFYQKKEKEKSGVIFYH